MSLFLRQHREEDSPFVANINALFQAVPVLNRYVGGVQTAPQTREMLSPLLSGMRVSQALPQHVARLSEFAAGADLTPDETVDIASRFEILEEGHRLAAASVSPRQMRDLFRRIVGEYADPVPATVRHSLRPPPSAATQVLPASMEAMLICPHCSSVNQKDYNFCHGCRAQLAESVQVAKAEKRFVTLVFTDLKGFTYASETVPPDVLGEMLNDLMRALCGAVVANGGRVVKTIGDAVMAVWGAPKSTEDDAVNAVYAALAMQEALERVNQEFSLKGLPQFKMRIGVNSGEVWAGYVQGPGIYSYDLLGHEVNRAARSESACEPGRILITESTRKKLEERGMPFDLVEAGDLKGKREGEISEAIPTFTVMGEKDGPGQGRSQLPLIGRGQEIAKLNALWEESQKDSKGRLVIISGEAGHGKSRLKQEFLDGIRGKEVDFLEWQVRGQEVQSRQPYKAIADAIRAQCGIGARDTWDASERKLREFVQTTNPTQTGVDLEIHIQLLGNLLGIPFAERPDEVRFIMGHFSLLRERTLEAVVSLFRSLLKRRRILFILEDLHWMDAGTIEFIQALLERLHDMPFFVLALARPEFFEQETRFAEGDYAADRIDLHKMDREPLGEMITAILGDAVPVQTREYLINQSGRSPYLLQEMARAIREGWRVERDPATQRLQFVGPRGVKVPNPAAGFLQTRIDLLPDGHKELLKRSSIFESDFQPRDAHPYYASKRRMELPFLLRDLARKGFLTPLARDRYEFAHALLRETVYNQIPSTERKRLHGRRAEFLRDHESSEPATIAYHYERAEKHPDAADYYYRAAELVRFYWDKAIYFYRKASDLEPAESPLRFKYLRGWDNALYLSGQYAAEDDVFAMSAPLVERLSPLDQAGHYYRVGRSLIRRREYAAAETHLAQALDIADPLSSSDRAALKLKGHILVDLAISWTQNGQLTKAESLLPMAEQIGRTVEDGLVLGRALWSLAHLDSRRGDLYKALLATREANELFLKIADFNRYVFTLTNLGWNYCTLGQYDLAEETLRRALSLSKKFEGQAQGMESLFNSLGRVLTLKGKTEEAIATLQSNLAKHHYEVFTRVYLAQAYLQAKRLEDAESQARTALQVSLERKKSENEHSENEAIARMAMAQVFLRKGDAEGARVQSQKSIETLERLGGVEAFSLEIPLTHAKILLSLERRDEAKAVLASLRQKIVAIADQISDTNYQGRFLGGVEVHHEALLLAKDLGLDTGTPIP